MLKRFTKWVNTIHIKKKILSVFVLSIILPISALLLIFSGQMNTELTQREQVLMNGELSRIQVNLDTIVNTTDMLAAMYSTDKELSWSLETFSDASMGSLEIIRAIDKRILTDKMVHNFIDQIAIYYENQNLFETIYARQLTKEVQEMEWYKAFHASDALTYIHSQVDPDTPQGHIILIKKLNLVRYESKNIVKFDLSEASVQNLFQSEVLKKSKAEVYLVNPDGQIVTSNNPQAPQLFNNIQLNDPASLSALDFENTSMLKGWRVIAISNQHALSDIFIKNMISLIAMVLIIFGVAMLLFYLLSHSIIWRLEHMAKVIESSKDEELIEIEVPMGSDEIGEMGSRYNYMIKRTRFLMAQIVQARYEVDALLQEKIEANALLSVSNQELMSANEELSASLEEIEMQGKKINALIYQDLLTSLDNRFAITGYINNQLETPCQIKTFAVGFMDVDNFKYINDTYGHHIGDEIIRKMGQRLSTFESDLVRIGRFGGDEFIVTIRNFQDDTAVLSLCEFIRESMKESITIDNHSFFITISMGIATYPQHGIVSKELFMLADIALYKAKGQGKDRVIFYDESMNQMLVDKVALQSLIMKAFKDQQFILNYQPYYEAKTKALVGCEALIRWMPEAGLKISPFMLIQNAEEMGLIVQLGEWIFTEACLFAKRLNQNRIEPIVVSINISATQLMQSNFYERVVSILRAHDIETRYICLEMTETILMYSIEKGSTIIQKFRDYGFMIALDDFGTGYSSLQYFRELPITSLKIDKAFINHIVNNDYDQQLVDQMIQIGHNRKLLVVAEGVEDNQQFDILNAFGCDIIQGYLLSKPVCEAQLIEMVSMEGVHL